MGTPEGHLDQTEADPVIATLLNQKGLNPVISNLQFAISNPHNYYTSDEIETLRLALEIIKMQSSEKLEVFLASNISPRLRSILETLEIAVFVFKQKDRVQSFIGKLELLS